MALLLCEDTGRTMLLNRQNMRERLVQALLKSCSEFSAQTRENNTMPLSVTKVEISDEEGTSGRPFIHLDGVPSLTPSETFYIIGVSAWALIKPFVSFFCHEYEMKVGSATPSVVETSCTVQRLEWHVIAGCAALEGLNVQCLRRSQRVWLKLPAESDDSFQSLVCSLGVHLFKRMCYVGCSEGMQMCPNTVAECEQTLLLCGIECNREAADFFGKFPGECETNSFQMIHEMPSSIFADGDSGLPTTDKGYLLQWEGSHTRLERNEDESVIALCRLDSIEDKLKGESDVSSSYEVKPWKAPRERVKCPGCRSFFSDNVSGLQTLSHHLMSSHKKHAVLYRRVLRRRLSQFGGPWDSK